MLLIPSYRSVSYVFMQYIVASVPAVYLWDRERAGGSLCKR